jgi:hypothetical protein
MAIPVITLQLRQRMHEANPSQDSVVLWMLEYGSVIEIVVEKRGGAPQDISAATTKNFLLWRPKASGTVVEAVAAAFVTDGTDGKLDYTIASGILDVVGSWQVQCELIYSDGAHFTTPTSFVVRRPGG